MELQLVSVGVSGREQRVAVTPSQVRQDLLCAHGAGREASAHSSQLTALPWFSMEPTAAATGRSEHVDLWQLLQGRISSLDPALDLPWSSGGRQDLPHWAKEGDSSSVQKFILTFTAATDLDPGAWPPSSLCYCWSSSQRLGAATRNFPSGASLTPLQTHMGMRPARLRKQTGRGDIWISISP